MSADNQPADNSAYRSRRDRQPFDQNVAASGMMDHVKTCFKKYADFNGRARRAEYWYFYLFNILVFLALYIPVIALIVSDSSLFFLPGILLLIFALGIILPLLAVVVRRLHDTGRSGWYALMAPVPVASFILLVFMIEDSKPGTNQWGPNPKNPAIGGENFEQDAFV